MNSIDLVRENPPKSIKGAIIRVFLIFIVAQILSTVVVAAYGILSGNGVNFENGDGISDLLMLYSFIFMIWGAIYHTKRQKRSCLALGFRRKNIVKDYIIGFVLASVFISALVGIVSIGGFYSISLSKNMNIFFVLLLMVGFGVQGLAEEVICRGLLQNEITAIKGTKWGVVISSLVFTLLHSFNPGMQFIPVINLFIFGIVFSLIFILTDNIWVAGAVHSAWNFFQGGIYGIKVSGNKIFYSILNTTMSGSSMVNGGKFGLEGSIVVTIAGILLCFVLIYFIKKKEVRTNG